MCADWARHGIQANGIGPGYFRTELTEPLQADPEFDAWLRRRVPAGPLGRAVRARRRRRLPRLGRVRLRQRPDPLRRRRPDRPLSDARLPRRRRSTRATGRPFAPTSGSRTGWIAAVGESGCEARGGRRRGRDPLPGLHRPARALGARAVRRPAAHAEDPAGLHDRGDLPRRARAGAGRADGARRGRRTCARSRATGRRSGRGRRSPSTSTRSTRPGRRSTLVPSVGHGAVRDLVLGGDACAVAGQLARCAARCGSALEAGARMLSFGLVYIPGALRARPTSSSRSRRRRPRSARRSSRTSATRGAACSRRSAR